MPIVKFNYADRKLSFPDKTKLKNFIAALFTKEGKELDSINYIFCSDDYLLQINNNHLNHDYYTDIITFSLQEKGEPIIGEVYISLDRIKDNAIIQGTNLINETLRVIFHGCLHLCGYKDKTKKDIKAMRGKEDFYITQYISL
ncbi:rRNA maturation RNase YbeY [Parasediminibacterium sp. JCM 36343]|uniref:rRNA maturation RNase YbeY n=1 Tax=Parasediminibacterium sp. JCM 36343 TaxID=3374279 RepID=UPI003978B418